MNNFYEMYMKQYDSMNHRHGWHSVKVPHQSAVDVAGQFTAAWSVTFSSYYWFSGSEDVFVDGEMEVCKEGNAYLFRNMDMAWYWHDNIDANSIPDIWKRNHDLGATIAEGFFGGCAS